ncbi:O-antigen polymerase [Orbaceae bacterium ac157xtp]
MFILFYFILLSTHCFIGLFFYKKNLFNTINFFSIHYVLLSVFAVSGTLLVYFNIFEGEYFFSVIEGKTDVILISMNLIVWSSVGLFLPIIILNNIFKKNLIINSYIQYNRKYPSSSFFIKIFTIIYLFCSIFYVIESHPSVPYMLLTNHDLMSVAARRYDFVENYMGNGLIRSVSINGSYLMLFFIGYQYKLLKIKNLFLIAYALFILLIMGEKAPVIFAVFFFFSGFLMCSKKIIKIKLILITVLIMYGLYYFQFSDFDDVGYNFLSRIFIAQNIAVFLSVDQYLLGRELIGFGSFRSGFLLFLFGIDNPVPIASYSFVDIYYPGMRGLGTINVNGIYIHEALSNFGMLVAILSPVFLGIMYYVILSFLKRISYTFVSLVIYIYLSLRITSLLTSFNQSIFNSETILTISLLVLVHICTKIKGH